MNLRDLLSSICFFIFLACSAHGSADEWVAVKDTSLMLAPSSVLDFSNLIPMPNVVEKRIVINSAGHMAFENQPEKSQRFLIGSLGFGINVGGFPSHEMIDLYVQQYKMHGYNMVRMDFVESNLMEGRQGDFDYNPEQLDRFYYLVSALKKNGIYLILNGLSSSNGAYGNIKERWLSKQHFLQYDVYFDANAQAHWKKLITTMYGATNPYTGISVLKDPTLAGLIMVNESNLAFISRGGASAKLKPHFSKWLKSKYGGHKQLKAAWGGELKATENIELNQIDFPSPDAWTSKRMADVQQFFFDTEKKTAGWMTAYLREQGFQGMVSSYNTWHAPAAQAIRGQQPWVDMHNYFAHPEYMNEQQIKVRQDSMLKDGAGYIRELTSAKHIGKPYTVSEHGQVFWNQYRRENGLALPAYAAFQSWDGFCQHFGAVNLSYASLNGNQSIIQPFNVGYDPIARATETLAALLYLRGDVAPAKHMLGVKFGADDAFNRSAHLGSTPSDISKLGLITGVGLDWEGKWLKSSKNNDYDGQMSFNQQGFGLVSNGAVSLVQASQSMGVKLDQLVKSYAGGLAYKASKVSLIADERWAARVQSLRDAGWLPASNLTDAKSGIFQSDTGEIVLDSEQKRLTVITPKTEAIVFDEFKPSKLNNLSLLSAEGGALVAISAMDGQTLSASKQMLLILSTDARNSNMKFTDSSNETSVSLGNAPVLIKANKIKLALKNANKEQLKVFSLNLRGQRIDAINLKQTNTSIEFEVDIRKLSHGATTYFEISV